MKANYRVGELAEYFGISADTLRLYDRMGILSPTKGENGYRVYSHEDMISMSYILRLRQLELPLKDIEQLADEESLERAEAVLEDREALLSKRIAELERVTQIAREYRSMFRATRENIGKFSVVQSPRMILREIGDSFMEATAALDTIDTAHVRRFTSLTAAHYLLESTYPGALYDNSQRKEAQRFAVSILDGDGSVVIPEACREHFTVLEPRRAVYTAAKCRAGEDYEDFIRLHEYLKAGGFAVEDEMVVVFVSVRNGKSRSEDYYQIWVPVT